MRQKIFNIIILNICIGIYEKPLKLILTINEVHLLKHDKIYSINDYIVINYPHKLYYNLK